MVNKKRQELIIQNLKSISSQVRVNSIIQLTNFPTMPVEEKIKLLQVCLNDSEESVQNAAKAAIAKLSGNQNTGSSPITSPATNGFTSPSMVSSPISSLPSGNNSGLAKPVMPNLNNNSNINIANSAANMNSGPSQVPFPQMSSKLGVPPVRPQSNVSNTVNMANMPNMVNTPNIGNVTNQVSPQATTQGPLAQVQQQPSTPSIQQGARPASSKGLVLIDGPVDPSLPPIQNSGDIGFLIQHISDLISTKPAGYLTRLFEMAKSVHEEVALTALQNLFIIKDNRIPPHILALLNDNSYTSQRRFLMLKIVMDTEVSLSVDLLENILLKEKDVIIKSGLVKVFAKNCDQGGIPMLIRCLNDEDPRVRANTVEVIEAQNIRGCEKEIINLLNDVENRVKVNAAKYLVKIGYQQAFLTLRAMLVSPEVWLRDSVIFALGEIADQASLVLLRAALKDPNQGIRLSVLKSLAKINNNMARQILKAATGDPDQVVAQVAMSLYDKIKDTPLRELNGIGQNKPIASATQQNNAVPQNRVMPNGQQSPIASPMANSQNPIPNVQRPPIVPNQANTPSTATASSTNVGSLNPPSPQSIPNIPSLQSVLPSIAGNNQQNNNQVPPMGNRSIQPPVAPSVGGNRMPIPQNTNIGTKNISQTPLPKVANNIPRPLPPLQSRQPVGGLSPLPPLNSQSNNLRSQTPNQAPVTASSPTGTPNFEKPRSAAIYAKLCSPSVDEQRNGMRDVVFVMGQDQMLLLEKALTLADESIRIAVVKILARKRTPESKAMLSRLSQDNNETISSLAKKALMILK